MMHTWLSFDDLAASMTSSVEVITVRAGTWTVSATFSTDELE